MRIFPQLINVAFSPARRLSTSAKSIKIWSLTQTSFDPTSGFFGCNAAVVHVSFTPRTCTLAVFRSKAVYRGAMGSIIFLFNDQILSHSIWTTEREDPWAIMNCFSPSTVIPWRRTPRTVGNRGSSHPSTWPFWTNHVSLRLDRTVFIMLRRAYSQM